MKKAFIICIIFFTVLSVFVTSSHSETSKVVILPFHTNSTEDVTTLNNSIFSMLTSRLHVKDQVEITDEISGFNDQIISDEHLARNLGEKNDLDYVILGELTAFSGFISIDVTVVDVKDKSRLLSFFGNSTSRNDIISAINQVADDINETVFGREVTRRYQEAEIKKEADNNQHPEKLLDGVFIKNKEDSDPFWKIW